MNRKEAREGLRSDDEHVRLKSARYFQLTAQEADVPTIREAHRHEDVRWIRAALKRALETANGTRTPASPTLEERDTGGVSDEIYRKALRDATSSLVHEIRPRIGQVRWAASREVPDYGESQTRARLERLAEHLQAVDRLRQATQPTEITEFELSEWIKRVVQDEMRQERVDTEFAGQSPLVVIADKRLLEMALGNSIRNALEATLEVYDPEQAPPLLVSWGQTELDNWIAISDEGPGPPKGASQAFEQGVSNKDGHLGMGLTITRTAISSLGGEVKLSPRRRAGGAILEIRWPLPGANGQ